MKFTQWVVEWAIDNGPRVPLVWGPVIVDRHSGRPRMYDTKSIAADARKAFYRGRGVRYRVRKVTFGEIDQ